MRQPVRLCLLPVLLALCMAPAGALAPSTFDPVIGHALLCLNQPDAGYYYSYLNKYFGKPFKQDGGAYWFHASANLWGVAVTDVMVSDGSSDQTFIGAVMESSPEALEAAIVTAMGIHHYKIEAGKFPLRESPDASVIAYFNKKSKIYCTKSQYLVPK
jgi:hypothetical protein